MIPSPPRMGWRASSIACSNALAPTVSTNCILSKAICLTAPNEPEIGFCFRNDQSLLFAPHPVHERLAEQTPRDLIGWLAEERRLQNGEGLAALMRRASGRPPVDAKFFAHAA